MWKKRAETTWERGVVVKLISKTSSCIRPIKENEKCLLSKPFSAILDAEGCHFCDLQVNSFMAIFLC